MRASNNYLLALMQISCMMQEHETSIKWMQKPYGVDATLMMFSLVIREHMMCSHQGDTTITRPWNLMILRTKIFVQFLKFLAKHFLICFQVLIDFRILGEKWHCPCENKTKSLSCMLFMIHQPRGKRSIDLL